MLSLYVFWIVRTLSWPTLALGATIVAAAAVLRQALDFLLNNLGTSDVGPVVWIVFSAMGAGVVLLLARRAVRPVALLPALAVFGLGLGFSLTFDLAIERVHLIFFGTLGFCAARDAGGQGPLASIPVLVFCTLVATLDEVFQFYLPYRVGDPRDVLFGCIGATWGVALHGSESLGRRLVGVSPRLNTLDTRSGPL